MPRAFALALVALVASLVAACGGDSKKGGDYISQADAICKREASKAPRASGRPTPQDAERQVAHREQLREKLNALKPPAGLAARVSQYDALTKQIIAGNRQRAVELRRRDAAAVARNGLEINRINVKRSKLATQIGFKRCGQLNAGPGSPAIAPLGTDPSIIARADEACKRADLTQYALLVRANTGFAEAGKVLSTAARAGRQAQKQLQALKPPAKDRQAFAAYLSALDRRLKLAEQRAAAASRNDSNAFRELSVQVFALSREQLGPATQLGFEVCGRLGSSGI